MDDDDDVDDDSGISSGPTDTHLPQETLSWLLISTKGPLKSLHGISSFDFFLRLEKEEEEKEEESRSITQRPGSRFCWGRHVRPQVALQLLLNGRAQMHADADNGRTRCHAVSARVTET